MIETGGIFFCIPSAEFVPLFRSLDRQVRGAGLPGQGIVKPLARLAADSLGNSRFQGLRSQGRG